MVHLKMEQLLSTHIVKYQALMQISTKMKLSKLQKILKLFILEDNFYEV